MEKKIKDWVSKNTQNQDCWKNFDDLHIAGDKKEWLNKGIELYKEVNNYLKKEELSFYPELSIRLNYSKDKTGINFTNKEDVTKQLSHTPPSVYIFPKTYDKLESIKSMSTLIKKDVLNISNAYYRERYDEDENEYYRAIFVVPE